MFFYFVAQQSIQLGVSTEMIMRETDRHYTHSARLKSFLLNQYSTVQEISKGYDCNYLPLIIHYIFCQTGSRNVQVERLEMTKPRDIRLDRRQYKEISYGITSKPIGSLLFLFGQRKNVSTFQLLCSYVCSKSNITWQFEIMSAGLNRGVGT